MVIIISRGCVSLSHGGALYNHNLEILLIGGRALRETKRGNSFALSCPLPYSNGLSNTMILFDITYCMIILRWRY